jgi:hypothetical protein
MGFSKAGAPTTPKTANVGRVTDILEGKPTSTNNYLMAPVEIQGFGASKNFTSRIFYRPEWFVDGFAPEALMQVEGGDKMHSVYCGNISQEGGTSTLLGLCALNQERLDALADSLFEAEIGKMVTAEGEFDVPQVIEAVTQVLHEHLVGDNPVGYVLGQQMSKTGRVDENGKTIKIPSKYEEIKEWFDPENDKDLKRMITRAEKNAKQIANNTDPKKKIIPFQVLFSQDKAAEVPY